MTVSEGKIANSLQGLGPRKETPAKLQLEKIIRKSNSVTEETEGGAVKTEIVAKSRASRHEASFPKLSSSG
jgi:hypothetical protein